MPAEPDWFDPSGDEETTSAMLPGFQSGGRVERTGIALVHEGEYIVPAPDSEARISSGAEAAGDGQVINYYFPVEIEVIGTLSNDQIGRVADFVFDALETELASRI